MKDTITVKFQFCIQYVTEQAKRVIKHFIQVLHKFTEMKWHDDFSFINILISIIP